MIPEVLFIVQLIAAFVSLIPFMATFWFKDRVETPYYRALVLIVSAWAVLYGLELVLPTLEEKVLIQQIRFTIQPFAGVVTLFLAAKHFRWEKLLTTKARIIICFIPAVTAILSITNGYHGLFRHDYYLIDHGELVTLGFQNGPWYEVFASCTYLMISLTIIMAINATREVNRTFARQGMALGLAVIIPLLVDFLFYNGLSIIPGYNMSSASFTISSLLIFWGMFRLQMLDIKPIARAEVMEQMDDPVLVLDERERVVDFNTSAARAFSWKEEEHLGGSISDLFPELVAALNVKDPSGVLQEVEYHRDHVSVVYEAKISDVRIGDTITERIVILRDITIRRNALESLKENERKYRELIERAPFPVIIIDVEDGRVILVNERTERQFGTERKKVVGKTVKDLYAIKTDGLKFVDIIAKAEKVTDFETRMLTADGRSFWAYISAMIMQFEGRTVVFMALNDITDRKRMEDALHVTNTKMMLLSSISRHDMMNQLTALSGYFQLAEGSGSPERQGMMFGKMEQSIKAIQNMIEFTKVYQELGVNAPGWFDLETMVTSTRSKLNLTTIDVRCELKGVKMFGDALLERVFFNLLENSVRHGGNITRMSFTIEDRASGKVIVYQDDGVGIPPADKENIFCRGFGKNMGLGLFLSKEILSITGMSIVENGEPGKGARFEIFVPEDIYRQDDT